MASQHDRRRLGTASATISAGTLIFLAAGAGPAMATTHTSTNATDCKLGDLLCGILGGTTKKKPADTPKPTTSTKPKPKPASKPAAKPRPKPAHAPQSAGGGSHGLVAPPPLAVPDGTVPQTSTSIPVPPALPDITAQDPVVMPGQPAPPQAEPAHLTASSEPAGETMPPALIAAASGLIGAVTALNISVINRRRRERG